MTQVAPLVTVIVPAWNEESDIGGCIEAIGHQDHPSDRIQLVVVDGASDDGTVEELRRAAAPFAFAEVVVATNPARRTSISLNAGLALAKGEYVARVDARSRIGPSYVSTCIGVLDTRSDVGVVGGAQVAQPRGGGLVEAGIARALRNPWATGLSRYRRSTSSGPSDTVWMGVFRTADLRFLGGWAEEVALNEDFDLNERFRARGLTVWFEACLRSRYLPRQTFGRLGRQYFYFGRVKGMWWARRDRPTTRQTLLLGLPLAGAAVVAAGYRAVGKPALLAVPAGLLALDLTSREGSADARTHIAAAGAIGVVSGSWWAGVVVGALGELAGVRHEHG